MGFSIMYYSCDQVILVIKDISIALQNLCDIVTSLFFDFVFPLARLHAIVCIILATDSFL